MVLPIWIRPKFAPRKATSAVTVSPVRVTSSGVKAFAKAPRPATTRSTTAKSLRRPRGEGSQGVQGGADLSTLESAAAHRLKVANRVGRRLVGRGSVAGRCHEHADDELDRRHDVEDRTIEGSLSQCISVA